jgi:hypothetical protein
MTEVMNKDISQSSQSILAADSDKARYNLAQFEKLDFEAWNKRDWDLFRKLHGEKVKVAGFAQETDNGDDHVAWARAYLEKYPDNQIEEHPIRIGAGDWTAVTGVFNDGTTMATIARWEDGRVAEEYLFQLTTS